MDLPKILVTALAMALFATSGAFAATLSAVDDFSLGSNSNGAGRYLAGGSVRAAGENPCAAKFAGAELGCWRNGGLDPDPQDMSNVVVRWSAPAAGDDAIQGDFFGIVLNERAPSVEVDDNSASLFSLATMDNQGQIDTFATVLSLLPGDAIDVHADTGSGDTNGGSGGPRFLDTGRAIAIASGIAGPASLGMFGCALLALSLALRRSRR